MMAMTETAGGRNTDAIQLSKDIPAVQEGESEDMQKLPASR